MNIREYAEADSGAVRKLLECAFPTPVEADLVEQLRLDGDNAIELVAEDQGAIVGHVFFSPVEAPFRALALGPVAVAPERQRGGIGSALIDAGHDRARALGFEAVFVLGEPGYYRRFDYDPGLARGFSSPYSGPYFMALALGSELSAMTGEVRHAPAFAALG